MQHLDFRKKIALGALLHDIGKFRQRAGSYQGTHSQIGYDWLRQFYDEGIAAYARNHHGNEKETWETLSSLIVFEADNCAASERSTKFTPEEDLEKQWDKQLMLLSIFSWVQNPASPNHKNSDNISYIPLSRTDKWNPPIREKEGKNTPEDYQKIWRDFEDEFKKIKENNMLNNIDAIQMLLEKYTSTIPSMTLRIEVSKEKDNKHKHPDISLFDHLKLTAAFTLCLYDYYREKHNIEDQTFNESCIEQITGDKTWEPEGEKPFLLVGGDISGVQNFIYTISSKGALKTLKGRSFFVELLTEHVADRIIEKLNLTRCNIIFTGGGHFYLIAANTVQTTNTIKEIRKNINNHLFEAYNGSIQVFLESVEFGKYDIMDISPIWSKLSSKLEESKKRKWEDLIDKVLCEPRMPHQDCLTSNCEVCGRDDISIQEERVFPNDDGKVLLCHTCSTQMKLGSMLQKTTRDSKSRPVIIRTDETPDDKENWLNIENRYYKPCSLDDLKNNDKLTSLSGVFHLNDWDGDSYKYPTSRLLLASVYFHGEKGLLDLESMTNAGFGANRIAALLMDIDNLGIIFSKAIARDKRTFSMTASLSRNLSLFFKYHIDCLMEGKKGYPQITPILHEPNKKPLVTIVYSGGDDLFLIGHWLDVCKASFTIYETFKEYTKNNYITLSGGITLGTPHDPIHIMAEAGKDAEYMAKSGGKNRLTMMDTHILKWNEAFLIKNKILKLFAPFTKASDGHLVIADTSPISMGFLYRLLFLSRYQKKKDAWAIPKLAYMFGRINISNSEEIIQNAYNRLKEFIFSGKKAQTQWHLMETTLICLLLMLRKGGSNAES